MKKKNMKKKKAQAPARVMVIDRAQYKKIKGMDHQQMSAFLESYHRRVHGNSTEEFTTVLLEAIARTKGIGEKIGAKLQENFMKILEERSHLEGMKA
ncbi:MAG: hypothetical protein Q4A78_12005 [Peptostreptococcaceae bacterium]|nr:hypothetical protein [Peptostreptococcaceae bacterium]